MTIQQKARQAAKDMAFKTNGDTSIGSQSRDAIADAVAVAVLQEVERLWSTRGGISYRDLDALLALAVPTEGCAKDDGDAVIARTANERHLLKLYRENLCGDEHCEGARFSAVQDVLKGARAHREIAMAVKRYMTEQSLGVRRVSGSAYGCFGGTRVRRLRRSAASR